MKIIKITHAPLFAFALMLGASSVNSENRPPDQTDVDRSIQESSPNGSVSPPMGGGIIADEGTFFEDSAEDLEGDSRAQIGNEGPTINFGEGVKPDSDVTRGSNAAKGTGTGSSADSNQAGPGGSMNSNSPDGPPIAQNSGIVQGSDSAANM